MVFNIFSLEISAHSLNWVLIICVAHNKLFSSRHFLVYTPSKLSPGAVPDALRDIMESVHYSFTFSYIFHIILKVES